jgi:hypothetical protein
MPPITGGCAEILPHISTCLGKLCCGARLAVFSLPPLTEETGPLAVLAMVFGPLKNGESRSISIALESVALLRRHRTHQAELKLANRTHYHDHGLVFAKEWEQLQRHGDMLGHPLPMNSLGQPVKASLQPWNTRRRPPGSGVFETPQAFYFEMTTVMRILQRAGRPLTQEGVASFMVERDGGRSLTDSVVKKLRC